MYKIITDTHLGHVQHRQLSFILGESGGQTLNTTILTFCRRISKITFMKFFHTNIL